MALTIYDKDHSSEEDRWVTLGRAESGQLLVVVHTWTWIEPAEAKVRVISARRADSGEIRDYQDIPR
ncbi:MAG: BrnT family toxin [Thiocapsa sp.]|uniref:BrnT family toxin n=1 Tax=Thiocapsa sp. TaxID=2024551 RepID=UPI001BCDEDD2|nr:BrnT family toxin [Thiocapsa sp.]QVL48725.1 MAG: BrnT family toxin [Thiocapsa sp.]